MHNQVLFLYIKDCLRSSYVQRNCEGIKKYINKTKTTNGGVKVDSIKNIITNYFYVF